MRPVRRRATPIVLVVLALGSIPGPLPAEPPLWPVFRDRTQVEIRNVDVWVTDADGHPVPDLGRDDFALSVDGEAVEITHFRAVREGLVGSPPPVDPVSPADPEGAPDGPGAAAPDLHLLILVDNQNITAANRGRVFARLREVLLESWRPGLQVLLASHDPSLVIHQGLTGVPHEVFAALRRLEGARTQGSRLEQEQQNLLRAIAAVDAEAGSGLFGTKDRFAGPSLEEQETGGEEQSQLTARIAAEARALLPRIAAYAEERHRDVRDALESLEQLAAAAGGLPGRRAVLYVGDGLPMRPGEAIYEAYERRFQALSNLSADISPPALAAREDAGAPLRALVSRASTDRVSLYTLFAAPPAVRGSAAARGSAGGNFAGWLDSFGSTEQRNRQEPLILMAEGTGGRAALSASDFGTVLAGIFTDFDNYYSLAYSPDRRPDSRRDRHTVEVRVRRRGLEVRHRGTFQAVTEAERQAARVLSALLLGDTDNRLGISLEARDATAGEGGNFVVPILVRLPLSRLVLLPEGTEHRAQVSVTVAVRDAAGRTSRMVRHLCPFQIPNSEVLVALGRTMVCGLRLLMRAGPQVVAVAVRDDLAAVDATATLAVEVGAEPPRPGAATGIDRPPPGEG